MAILVSIRIIGSKTDSGNERSLSVLLMHFVSVAQRQNSFGLPVL